MVRQNYKQISKQKSEIMLGKLSFALALVAAVDAFKLEPVTNMAQINADAE